MLASTGMGVGHSLVSRFYSGVKGTGRLVVASPRLARTCLRCSMEITVCLVSSAAINIGTLFEASGKEVDAVLRKLADTIDPV